MAALTQCGDALRYAAQRFRDDKEVVLAAVIQNGDALGYAAQRFMDDKEVVLAAVYRMEMPSSSLRNGCRQDAELKSQRDRGR